MQSIHICLFCYTYYRFFLSLYLSSSSFFTLPSLLLPRQETNKRTALPITNMRDHCRMHYTCRMHCSCRSRPLKTTAACTVLGGRQYLLQCCWKLSRLCVRTENNKYEQGCKRCTLHRLYQGILYFQHVIRFNGTLTNVISCTLVSKILERIFTESKNSQNSYVNISYNEFHPNRQYV
jgi:hypothetical protein